MSVAKGDAGDGDRLTVNHNLSTRTARLLSTAVLAAVASTSLAACGSSGSAGSAIPHPIAPPGVVSPSGTSLLTLTVRKSVTTQATSSSARRVSFVSPAAQSVAIKLISFNGQAYTTQTTPVVLPLAGAGCSNDGTTQTCTLALSSQPVGNNIYEVKAWSGSDGTGNVLSLNSAGVTVNAAPAVNTLNIVLDGVVKHMVFSPSSISIPDGVPYSYNVIVQPTDAANYIIVGAAPYVNASNATDTITVACDAHLTLQNASNGTLSAPFSFSNAVANNLAKVYYDGTTLVGLGNTQQCRANDTAANPQGVFALTTTGTGNLNVGVSDHNRTP